MHEICGMYIDDLVIFSKTWEDHMHDSRLELEKLLRAKLTVKLAKYFLACQEVNYLSHTIGIGKMTSWQA